MSKTLSELNGQHWKVTGHSTKETEFSSKEFKINYSGGIR